MDTGEFELDAEFLIKRANREGWVPRAYFRDQEESP